MFSINTNGSGYTVLHDFTGTATDGQYPGTGGLAIFGSTLYGMTESGGTGTNGVIYSLSTSGTAFTLLHSFVGGATDGSRPLGGLTISGSTLFGMTSSGGSLWWLARNGL